MSFWQDIADFFDSMADMKRSIDRIEMKQEEHIMATSSAAGEINLKLDELDAKTNDAAQRLRDIITMIQQANLPQAEKDAIIARIGAEADRFSTWGTNPDDPIPTT